MLDLTVTVGSLNSFIVKLKRGDTPFYAFLGRFARRLISPKTPRIPSFLRPPLRLFYEIHFGVISFVQGLLNVCYRGPLFQARCASFGRGVVIDRLPFVSGHVDIHIGNHVWIGGGISIFAGRTIDKPVLILKDHAQLAWNVTIVASKEVVIEEYARVASGCHISDSDGHPREADLRAQDAPLKVRDIRPVRIGKFAWIGNGSQIMKGVTIGEGAVIGAQSVVISDIPPYSLAIGNPAEVFMRNYGRPSKRNRANRSAGISPQDPS